MVCASTVRGSLEIYAANGVHHYLVDYRVTQPMVYASIW